MVTASVTGLFRTLLIIVGAFVLLRFIGQLMNAKRNVDEERDLNDRQRKFEAERKKSSENFGKTKILKSSKSAEDVDFEEVE